MSLTRARTLFVWCVILMAGQNVATGAERCTTEFRLPIVLRPATATGATTATPAAAFLVGDLTPGLHILDARSGRLLWTAGAAGAFTQRFAGMTAGFTASLAVIDTDGDGAHDRIYAGDLQGRLWRFDIDARGPASRWMTGGIFADLSGGTHGRGFLAAPDTTLIAPVGMRPWLSIALGTANTAPGNLNRFYVLRDRLPFTPWTQQQYDRWTPLVEGDLRLAEGASIDITSTPGAGFYINLGSRQVVAAAVTMDGNTYYSTTASSASLLPTCAAAIAPVSATVNAGSISAVDGSLNEVDLGRDAIRAMPSESGITLVRDQDSTLSGCAFDSNLRRSFWRREDAD
jgi:hypothetical protein